jgi:hypothetical protein
MCFRANEVEGYMMNKKLFKAVLFGLFVNVITVGCTTNVKNNSTNNYEDQALTSTVTSVLKGDSHFTNEIAVKTYNGIVQLSGFVTRVEADRAVQLVRTTKGVKAVNNAFILIQNDEISTKKNIAETSSTIPMQVTTEPVANNLDEVKTQCAKLFKTKTDKFGKCVLELTK